MQRRRRRKERTVPLMVSLVVLLLFVVSSSLCLPSDEPQNNQKKPANSRVREFMCKWAGLSYWQCSWVSEIRVGLALYACFNS